MDEKNLNALRNHATSLSGLLDNPQHGNPGWIGSVHADVRMLAIHTGLIKDLDKENADLKRENSELKQQLKSAVAHEKQAESKPDNANAKQHGKGKHNV